jgi:hypothetical protein
MRPSVGSKLESLYMPIEGKVRWRISMSNLTKEKRGALILTNPDAKLGSFLKEPGVHKH